MIRQTDINNLLIILLFLILSQSRSTFIARIDKIGNYTVISTHTSPIRRRYVSAIAEAFAEAKSTLRERFANANANSTINS